MTACSDIRTKLSALLDKELPAAEAVDVEDHLQSCEACQQEWRSLQSVDDQLKTLLTISDLTDRVHRIERSARVRPAKAESRPSRLARWAAIIAAIAATALVAFMARRQGEEKPLPRIVAPEVVARLVRATGAIEVLTPGSDQWAMVDPSQDYSVPKGSRLKTGDDVLCEFKTVDDGKIRLNGSAELVMHGSQRMELLKGQLWCLASEEAGIDIDIPLHGLQSPAIATMSCPSAGEIQCAAGDSFATCDSVSPQNQQASWTLGAFTCPVDPGETVTIDAQQKVDRKTDASVGGKVWQLPLLAVGNRVDDELIGSMNSLLAPIGRTKAQHLNERQIRNLGPKGALPLLAFAVSDSSRDQLSLRRTAVNIGADLADASAIDLLRELTSDPDVYISRLADQALKKIAKEAK